MSRKTRREKFEALPLREELEALARHYHHLENEHERAHPGGSVRRELEDKVLDVRARFERLLEEWVPDPELREAWLAYLAHRGPEPSEPTAIRPLVYAGTSEVTGSVVEIRRGEDELEVWVDGALVERIVGEEDFSSVGPLVRFRLNGTEFEETFTASPEALEALADFRDREGPPPLEHAAELLADGLIDVHFDLTPRGRRALANL